MKKKLLFTSIIVTALVVVLVGYTVTVRAARPLIPPGQAVREVLTAMENGNAAAADNYLGKDSRVEEYPDGSKAAIGSSLKTQDFKSFKVTEIIEATGTIVDGKVYVVNGEFIPKNADGVGDRPIKTLFVNTRKDANGEWKAYISSGP